MYYSGYLLYFLALECDFVMFTSVLVLTLDLLFVSCIQVLLELLIHSTGISQFC